MTITRPGQRRSSTIRLEMTGGWQWSNVRPSADPAAKRFVPSLTKSKPVLYLPVRRRNGVDEHPDLVIHVAVVESAKNRRNVDVASWVGTPLTIHVSNAWHVWSGRSVRLEAKLRGDLTARVHIDGKTVARWLDPSGPMRARINQNLFDFRVTAEVPGGRVSCTSRNRLFLYQRKTIVFLPGVFGNELDLQTAGGGVDAFPNFVGRHWPHAQTIGQMECDTDGEPLLEGRPLELLRLFGQGYDVEESIERALGRRFVWKLPEDFRLYDLEIFSYDWRLDLTRSAKQMLSRLARVQQRLRARPDTDDQLAVVGHSTGGVIIRRMLAEEAADEIISHAFFSNVPFRGAPKALSVLLTGCDPPGGEKMIPFIDAASMRGIALTMPILYHLAPSNAFPRSVVQVPDSLPRDRESEKAAWVAAIAARAPFGERMAVDAGAAADPAARERLARGADRWSRYWDEVLAWEKARGLYEHALPRSEFHSWPQRELSTRGLDGQAAARVRTGWSDGLARKAREFHELSEQIAKSGKWKDKAFVFYSVVPGESTTGRVVLEETSRVRTSAAAVYRPATFQQFIAGDARPRVATSRGALEFDEWARDGDDYEKVRWRLRVEREPGDATVPVRSQLGFGGEARVFRALPGNPDHVAAPNSTWMWERILDVLLGFGIEKHLVRADTTKGEVRGRP